MQTDYIWSSHLKLICSETVSTLPNTHHHHFFVFLDCCRNQDVNLGIQVCIFPIASSHSLPQSSIFPVKENFYLKARLDTGSWGGARILYIRDWKYLNKKSYSLQLNQCKSWTSFPLERKTKRNNNKYVKIDWASNKETIIKNQTI